LTVATGGIIAGACAASVETDVPTIGRRAKELRRRRRRRMEASERRSMDAGGLLLFYPDLT